MALRDERRGSAHRTSAASVGDGAGRAARDGSASSPTRQGSPHARRARRDSPAATDGQPYAARPMQRLATRLDGSVLIEPVVHRDSRGFFVETYRKNVLAEFGIREEFVQDNHSDRKSTRLNSSHRT